MTKKKHATFNMTKQHNLHFSQGLASGAQPALNCTPTAHSTQRQLHPPYPFSLSLSHSLTHSHLHTHTHSVFLSLEQPLQVKHGLDHSDGGGRVGVGRSKQKR